MNTSLSFVPGGPLLASPQPQSSYGLPIHTPPPGVAPQRVSTYRVNGVDKPPTFRAFLVPSDTVFNVQCPSLQL